MALVNFSLSYGWSSKRSRALVLLLGCIYLLNTSTQINLISFIIFRMGLA